MQYAVSQVATLLVKTVDRQLQNEGVGGSYVQLQKMVAFVAPLSYQSLTCASRVLKLRCMLTKNCH